MVLPLSEPLLAICVPVSGLTTSALLKCTIQSMLCAGEFGLELVPALSGALWSTLLVWRSTLQSCGLHCNLVCAYLNVLCVKNSIELSAEDSGKLCMGMVSMCSR
jgi:hypothetical protein